MGRSGGLTKQDPRGRLGKSGYQVGQLKLVLKGPIGGLW